MKKSENPAKHEVLIKQYLRSILDISGKFTQCTNALVLKSGFKGIHIA